MEMKRPRLELHIDDLVLHGIAPGQRHEIASAMEDELSRLLLEGGPGAAGSRSVPRLDAGTVTMPPGAAPSLVGRDIARAVHRGLSR